MKRNTSGRVVTPQTPEQLKQDREMAYVGKTSLYLQLQMKKCVVSDIGSS